MTATDRLGRDGSEDVAPFPSTLDLRGLRCPLPVLKTAKRLAAMRPGERVIILSDDPLAGLDLPAFCIQEGQPLLQVEQENGSGTRRFLVERAAHAPSLGAG